MTGLTQVITSVGNKHMTAYVFPPRLNITVYICLHVRFRFPPTWGCFDRTGPGFSFWNNNPQCSYKHGSLYFNVPPKPILQLKPILQRPDAAKHDGRAGLVNFHVMFMINTSRYRRENGGGAFKSWALFTGRRKWVKNHANWNQKLNESLPKACYFFPPSNI